MFTTARLKLTTWYLLIIMIVGLLFSGVIYRVVTHELEQGFVQAENHLRARERALRISAPPEIRQSLNDDFERARGRVFLWLLGINGFIVLFSAVLSFILAGKTLAPIARALDEQKRFISDASHELRTPLTALKTSMEVALRDKKLTLGSAKQVIGENLVEVNELGNLSENLLSLARLEKNQLSPTTRIDVNDLVTHILKRLNPLIRKKDLELKIDIESQVINGDEVSLTKLFTILLDNSIKYTPKKGWVSVSVSVIKNHLKFVVSDSGVGISKKDLDHIFDRFYRADNSRTKLGVTGFGLGLAIAKRIVDQLDGKITVTSGVGKGSTFEVKLPLN